MIGLENIFKPISKLMSEIGRLAKGTLKVVEDRFKRLHFISDNAFGPESEIIGTLFEDTLSNLQFVVFGTVYKRDVPDGKGVKEERVRYVSKVMIVKSLPSSLDGVDPDELTKGLREPKNGEMPIVEELVAQVGNSSKKLGSVFIDDRKRYKELMAQAHRHNPSGPANT